VPENHAHDDVDRERNADCSSVGISPDEPRSEQAQSATDAKQTAQIKNLNRKVMVAWVVAAFGPLIALAGLVFTGLQWKVADQQLRVMEAQLKDARYGAEQAQRDTDRALTNAESQAGSLKLLADANKVISDAAKINAENSTRIAGANETGVQTTRESLQLDQRPWLGIKGSSNGQFSPLVVAAIDLTFVNSGRTPALNADICTELKYASPEQLKNVNFRPAIPVTFPRDCQPFRMVTQQKTNIDTGPVRRRYLGVIYPEQEVTITTRGRGSSYEFGFTPTEGLMIEIGEAALLVLARATYADIFGRQHNMTYCGRWKPPSGQLLPCDSGNYAD